MNLNDVNFIASFAIDKYAPSLELPANKFVRLLHVAQLKHFKRKVGLPEEYQMGQPVNKQGFEISNVITSDIEPFKVIMGDKTPMLVVDNEGYATLPADFYYPSTLRIRYIKSGVESWKKVDILSDKEFNDRMTSALLKPSIRYPAANFQSGVIRFEPRNIKTAFFVYLRLPVQPVYGITMERGYAEYDPTTSTELEWNDTNIIDIIHIMLGDLGLNVGKTELIEISEKNKAQGI